MNKLEIKQEFEERILKILKFNSRIPKLYKQISEGDVSPFFIELFGDEVTFRIKLGQSLQTTFGMSLYEQFCETLGQSVGFKVELQKKIYGHFNADIHSYITSLLEDNNYIPNREKEFNEIRKLSSSGEAIEFPDSTVDVFITTPEGAEFLIDITTVKPNKKDFRTMKRKLLYWYAARINQSTNNIIEPYIAIPYNPESNKPNGIEYKRWSNFYDRKDLLVGEELWRKVSDNNFSIIDIIDVFRNISEHMNFDLDNLSDRKN